MLGVKKVRLLVLTKYNIYDIVKVKRKGKTTEKWRDPKKGITA